MNSRPNLRQQRTSAANTRLAQWGLTFYNQKSGYYSAFVLVESTVFQKPPLRQAWERWR
jgi:hypothetical protein